MSFLMASLACSNFFGRAPRRRADPAAQGFCGPARDLRPGPTATLVSSIALVPLEASWACVGSLPDRAQSIGNVGPEKLDPLQLPVSPHSRSLPSDAPSCDRT